MNSKKILFFSFIVIELLIALLLDFLTDSRGPLLDGVGNAQFQYVLGLIWAFLAIKKKQMNPILRMAIITSGVNMILLDYFFFFDTNLLYFLPLLAIAYMFIWPATED